MLSKKREFSSLSWAEKGGIGPPHIFKRYKKGTEKIK